MRLLIGTIALIMVVVAVITQQSGVYPKDALNWPTWFVRFRAMHRIGDA